MPVLWRESLPIIVDRANSMLRRRMYAPAKEHYLLAAEMAAIAERPDLEYAQLFAAWYCDERLHGRQPKELPTA